MTRYFCHRARCYAVIGGVLTHKDTHHMTRLFSYSLGRYLTPKLQRALTPAPR